MPALRETLTRLIGLDSPASALTEDGRLLRLGAALSLTAALSGADELHDRDLAPTTAVSLALNGVGGAQPMSAQEIRDRVRARFPALPALPERPRLDELLDAAGLGLVYDDAERAFRSPTRAADTTGLAPRLPTRHVPAGTPLVVGGHVGHRLTYSGHLPRTATAPADRTARSATSRRKGPVLARAIQLTVNGIATGLRNTG